MDTSNPNWYVVYTYPKLERQITSRLLKKNILTYLPLQKVTRQWSDRIKQLQIPLFPNYLFVNIKERERVDVLTVSGVARFLVFDGRPAILSDHEINLIRTLENAPLEIESTLVTGDQVKIMQGPFSGLEGVLFSKRGKERFGIRLNGLKQSLSLEVCSTILKKIN